MNNIFTSNSTIEECINIEGPQALTILTNYARHNALWFEINYDETGGDNWNIHLNGAGEGEAFFSGKRNRYLKNAVAYVLVEAEELYKDVIESPLYKDIIETKKLIAEFKDYSGII